MPKLAIVRGSSIPLKIGKYNIQEIGFAKALIKYGWSVDIFSRFEFNEQYDTVFVNGNSTLKLIKVQGIALPGQQCIYSNIFKLIKSYDAIQLQDSTNLMSQLVARTAKKMGVKTILWQGMYLKFKGWKWIFQYGFDVLIGLNFYKFIDISLAKTATAKKYLEQYNFKSISILPVGLDFSNFHNENNDNQKIKCFSKQHDLILLYVGNIEKRRNIFFLIDILFEIRKQINTGIIIVGTGPDLNQIKSKVRQLSLDENVLFCGTLPQNELSVIYNLSDVFLLPTNYEILGMVILEALFHNLPVISTKQAGPLEVLKEPYLGKCLELDVAKWVPSIIRFLNIASQNKNYRKDYVVQNYSWRKIAKEYVDMLLALEIPH